MATAVEPIKSVKIRKLFIALGKEEAADWTPGELKKKVPFLPKFGQEHPDEFDKLDPEQVKLFDVIKDLVTSGEEVPISFGKAGVEPRKAEKEGKKAVKAEVREKANKAKKAVKEKVKAKKKGTATHNFGANFKRGGKNGKPGVMGTIRNLLEGASKTNPITREEIWKELKKKFPDRSKDGMRVTVMAHVPTRLIAAGMDLKGTKEEGYYIPKSSKAKAKADAED